MRKNGLLGRRRQLKLCLLETQRSIKGTANSIFAVPDTKLELEKVRLKRSSSSRTRSQGGVEEKAHDFVVFERPRPLTPTVTFLMLLLLLVFQTATLQFPPGLPLVSEIAP